MSRRAILIVCLGLFMSGLNHRALVASLPTLTEVLRTDLRTIQWALLVYDLVLIGLVLSLGRLADLVGAKKIYTGGFVVFVVGSLLCGLSRSAAQLIGARAVQSVGASMLNATARPIVTLAVSPAERGKALGFTSMAFHVGFIAGPTLGGFLIDTVGWRWIFFLLVPIGLGGAWLAHRVLEPTPGRGQPVRLDLAGAALLFLANALLLYTMTRLPELGAAHPQVLALLGASAAAVSGFVAVERRAPTPILSVALFRNRLFGSAVLSLFFITSTQAGIYFLVPYYLQNLRGFSATEMGSMLIASSVMIVLLAPLAGWLSDRFGSRLLCTAGAATIVVGQAWIAALDLRSSVAAILLPIALIGVGWALFNAPNTSSLLGSVPRAEVGAASGIAVTTARIGGAAGVALASTLFSHRLQRAGLDPADLPPALWRDKAGIILKGFGHTVHLLNVLAVLSVFFSLARAKPKEFSEP